MAKPVLFPLGPRPPLSRGVTVATTVAALALATRASFCITGMTSVFVGGF